MSSKVKLRWDDFTKTVFQFQISVISEVLSECLNMQYMQLTWCVAYGSSWAQASLCKLFTLHSKSAKRAPSELNFSAERSGGTYFQAEPWRCSRICCKLYTWARNFRSFAWTVAPWRRCPEVDIQKQVWLMTAVVRITANTETLKLMLDFLLICSALRPARMMPFSSTDQKWIKVHTVLNTNSSLAGKFTQLWICWRFVETHSSPLKKQESKLLCDLDSHQSASIADAKPCSENSVGLCLWPLILPSS